MIREMGAQKENSRRGGLSYMYRDAKGTSWLIVGFWVCVPSAVVVCSAGRKSRYCSSSSSSRPSAYRKPCFLGRRRVSMHRSGSDVWPLATWAGRCCGVLLSPVGGSQEWRSYVIVISTILALFHEQYHSLLCLLLYTARSEGSSKALFSLASPER